ncbi:hypothetical protein ACWDOP_03480 [Nocardia sp. NPDC003693]
MGSGQPVWLRVEFGPVETSAALCGVDGTVRPLRLTDAGTAMPAGVYLSPTAGLEVGEVAREHGLTDPSRYAAEPNRWIESGRPTCELGGTTVPVQALVAAVLRSVIARAQPECGWNLPGGLELVHPREWSAQQTQVLVAAAYEVGYPADRLRLTTSAYEHANAAVGFAPAPAELSPVAATGAPARGGIDFSKPSPAPNGGADPRLPVTPIGQVAPHGTYDPPRPTAPRSNPAPSRNFSRWLPWLIAGMVVLVGAVLTGVGVLSSSDDQTGPDFEKIAVGYSGGVGYLAADPARNRLYAYNSADRTVSVVDTAAKTTIAEIPVEKAVRGMAADPETGTLWLLGDTALIKIDPGTHAVAGSVVVPSGVRGLTVNPITHDVYIAQANGDTVDAATGSVVVATIVDAATVQISGRIVARGNGLDVTTDPDTGLVYLNGSGNVRVIDPHTKSIVRQIDTSVSSDRIVIDPKTNVAYMSAKTSVVALDLTTGTSQLIDVGHEVFWIAIDPALGHVYASYSGGDGPTRLTVIDTASRSVKGTIEMRRNAEGITADSVSHRVYVRPLDSFVYLVEPCTLVACG